MQTVGGSFALYQHKEICAGTNSKNGISEYEVHEPSIHDKDLSFSAEEVVIYRSIVNVLNGSIEDKCIDLVNVYGFIDESRHHHGPNNLANLEVYKNTNFEEIQSLFNITQKLILEHSEEVLNVNTIDSASQVKW